MLRNLWFMLTLLLVGVFVLQHAVVVIPQNQLACVYRSNDDAKACKRVLAADGNLHGLWPFWESVQLLPVNPTLNVLTVKISIAGKSYETQWVLEWQLVDHAKPQGVLPKPLAELLGGAVVRTAAAPAQTFVASPVRHLSDAAPKIQQELAPLFAKQGIALKQVFLTSLRFPEEQQKRTQQVMHQQMQTLLAQQANQQQQTLLAAQQTAEQAGKRLLTGAYEQAQAARAQAQVKALQDYQAAFGTQTGLLEALWEAQHHSASKQEK